MVIHYFFFLFLCVLSALRDVKKNTVHKYIKVMMELVDMNSLGLFDF